MTWGARRLPFPANLTPGMRQYIEAFRQHGSFAAAAVALGVAEGTVINGLKKARLRAGVSCTGELVRRYFATKGVPA